MDARRVTGDENFLFFCQFSLLVAHFFTFNGSQNGFFDSV